MDISGPKSSSTSQRHAKVTNRSSSNPEPPSGVLDDFAAIYASRIYFQPLPQFKPKDLRASIDLWPSFVRYSFYALLLHYTEPCFYTNTKQAAIAFYTESAQKSVDELASQGIASVQILHSLCFLSLIDILGMSGLDRPQSLGLSFSIDSRQKNEHGHGLILGLLPDYQCSEDLHTQSALVSNKMTMPESDATGAYFSWKRHFHRNSQP